MPTARPSISASVGALLETVVTFVTITTALSVTPTPTRDDRIGMPAARKEPKVMARIRYDTSSPRSSGTRLGSELSL